MIFNNQIIVFVSKSWRSHLSVMFTRSPSTIITEVILVMMIFTSCSPASISTTPESFTEPQLTSSAYITSDGSLLPVRIWAPSDQLNGIAITLHGFNDYSNFMKDTAPFLTEHGFMVYAYDQRGFGETKTRGRWSGWGKLSDDLAAFTQLVREAHPDIPLFILGDSMGGAVAVTAMVSTQPEGVRGVILVAPALWARTEMPFYQRAALWLTAHTLPWLKVSGKSLDIVASDNEEMLRELGKDPLVIKETRVDVLYGLSNLMDQAYRSAEQFTPHTLLLYGEKDEIIPFPPVSSFYDRLPHKASGAQQLITYENGYHMLMRDLQAEVVLLDIVDWMKKQLE